MRLAKDLRARNTHALLELCRKRAVRKLSDELGRLMDDAHAQYVQRLRCAEGKQYRRLRRGSIFRHNWSGDLIDETHGRAVHRAVSQRPHIASWLYSRSLHLVKHLEPAPSNLTVWISDDGCNQASAERILQRHP